MIVAALCGLYDTLSDEMPKRYWSAEKVAGELRIDKEGKLAGVYTYADEPKGRRSLTVPEHETRTSAIKPFFLCDKTAYLMGRDEKRGETMREAAQDLHHEILDGIDDDGAKAVLRYFDKGCAKLQHDEDLSALGDAFIVFRGTWDGKLIHEREAIAKAWQNYREEREEGPEVQCSITGKAGISATLFPQQSGIPGANSSGAALISYNDECYCSYGKSTKDRARNASITADTAFKAGAALSYLFESMAHRTSVGETHVLFWTESTKPADDEFLRLALGLNPEHLAGEDEDLLARLKSALEDVRQGRKPAGIDRDTGYHVIGIAPNRSRLAVRFYEHGTIGGLEKALQTWLEDIDMIGKQAEAKSIGFYVRQVAPLGKAENVPGTLIAATESAVLRSRPLPQALFTAAIERMRADKGRCAGYDATPYRAAIMRAYLRRKARINGNHELERSITVALNEESRNQGYLLGRLFAALEKAQADAIGGVNASIKDRYIGAASATPAKVFPMLMKGAQHHVSKANYGVIDDKRICEIVSLMDAGNAFPPTLGYDDQGQFFIGYYQQREEIYTKKDGKEANNE